MEKTKEEKKNEIKTQPKTGLSIRSLNDLPKTTARSGDCEHLVILGDTSGSMGSYYGDGKKTRFQGLQEALTSLWEITDWFSCEPTCFAFSDELLKIPFDESNPPQLRSADFGGTDFKNALSKALSGEETNRIILCSDGESAKPTSQIEECQSRGIPVDTIYIGNSEEDRGAILLREISDETGGKFCLCKDAHELVEQFQQLETHNRLLLDYDPGDDSGPIQL